MGSRRQSLKLHPPPHNLLVLSFLSVEVPSLYALNAMRIEQGFQQVVPQLSSTWETDKTLQAILRRRLSPDLQDEVFDDLARFSNRLRDGQRARFRRWVRLAEVEEAEVTQLGLLADQAPPSVTQYDHYGRRVDILHTSEGWRALKRVAAEEGLVSIFHDRARYGAHGRTFGFAKTYLWSSPDSRGVGCPLSMTDGAARVIELHGTDDMKRTVRDRLVSRNANAAWTAGQWMTERPGGSDVSATETTATPIDAADKRMFLLDGLKWFSSATDGDVALALARTDPNVAKGSRGLSLFLIPLRLTADQTEARLRAISKLGRTPVEERPEDNVEASRNGIRIHRLKDKIGTKPLPTAELTLHSTLGELVGPLGGGVRTISSVLNITRLHSTFSSLAAHRRALDTAIAYAQVRELAGSGEKLADNALHATTLAKVEVAHRAMLQLAFTVVVLLGRSESGEATARDEDLLRLLTPVAKAFAAGRAGRGIAECMEAMGGQGYMEENLVGMVMRDAAVERIWEGTQNVLALDVVRAVSRSKGGVLESFDAVRLSSHFVAGRD